MNTHPTILARFFARLGVAAIACASMVCCPASTARGQVVPKEMPPPVRGLEVTNQLGKQVPLHLQFTNSEGKLVSLREFFNRPAMGHKGQKPVLVQMMYFRCPILCPTVLGKITTTLQQIDFTVGRDFDVLIVSIDPRDTPKDAAIQQTTQVISYNRPGGDVVRDGWNFVTSTPENARALADALGFPYRYQPESGEFSHGAALFILTPEGKVSRTLTGLNYPASDIRLALLEASGGKIGTVFDAFTLWCYHFDPTTGTYTLAAMRVMRVGGILTMAFIGALLAVMWRAESRKKRLAAPFAATRAGEHPASPSAPLPVSASLTGSTP